MAMPLLDFLTGRARQALPFLESAAAKGLSPTAALASLKGLTPTFNRQRMLDVYAALQNRIDPERTARLIGDNTPFPEDLHATSPAEIKDNYQYVVAGVDEFGQEAGFVTVGAAAPLTPLEVRRRAGELFTAEPDLYLEEPQIPVAAVSIVKATRKGGL